MMTVVLASPVSQLLYVFATGTLRFTYEGNRVQPNQTPAEVSVAKLSPMLVCSRNA